MKKILVTGGAGYIGSHTVVSLMERGFTPVIADNFANSQPSALEGIRAITGQKAIFVEGDCGDPAFLASLFGQHHIDGVIHFAAFKAVGESVENPLAYYRNNVGSLLHLLEAMKDGNVRNLVFSSSCAVYGQPSENPVRESTPRRDAESPYANTKRIGEDILADAVRARFPFRIVSLRYFNPIGAHPTAHLGEWPRGCPNNLVPYLTQTVAGWRRELSVFGDDYDTPDGTCIRDFCHVVDLAEAHTKALAFLREKKEMGLDTFNIGTGRGHSVRDVIRTFTEATGRKVPHAIAPRRPGDIQQIWADTSKAAKQLQWQSRFTLKDALADAWRWQEKLNARRTSPEKP